MAIDAALNVYIGHDSREAVASEVASHSILARTHANVSIRYLKHRELRQAGVFQRPWMVNAKDGNWVDMMDMKPFSTEFSHSRFLVPHLQEYKGWALFFDSDMIFVSDIKKLFKLCDDKFAVMCVKHNHVPTDASIKMDSRLQTRYFRKNWSSFVLFNCGHPSNKKLTPEIVNTWDGSRLHAFEWLRDHEIGALPSSYNYISGVSPKLVDATPDVLHYTEGGPWFADCQEVPYAQMWLDEYESWCRSDKSYPERYSHIPSMRFDGKLDKETVRHWRTWEDGKLVRPD